MEKPPSPKEPFRQSLQEIAVNASWFTPGQGETQNDVIRAMQPMLTSLLEQTEVPTLKRVVATWAELADWGESLGINNMSRFYQESKAPSRVPPAMQWMRNNLRAPWDLSLCVGRSTVAKGRHGVGARQAPTAEPVMLWALLEDVGSSCACHPEQHCSCTGPGGDLPSGLWLPSA